MSSSSSSMRRLPTSTLDTLGAPTPVREVREAVVLDLARRRLFRISHSRRAPSLQRLFFVLGLDVLLLVPLSLVVARCVHLPHSVLCCFRDCSRPHPPAENRGLVLDLLGINTSAPGINASELDDTPTDVRYRGPARRAHLEVLLLRQHLNLWPFVLWPDIYTAPEFNAIVSF